MLEEQQNIGDPIAASSLGKLLLQLPRLVVFDGSEATDEQLSRS
jgi:hypothetical protein